MLWKGQYIALVMLYISSYVDAVTVSDVNRLKETLRNGYDKSTTPISGYAPLIVDVFFVVTNIADLDESVEKLTTNLQMNLEWTDESMIWNASETGIHNVSFNREDVWVPELFVVNKHSHISNGIEEKRYWPILYISSGMGWFEKRVTAETTCDLDTFDFPYDSHNCTIEFAVNKVGVRVKADFKEFVMDWFHPDGSWDVTHGTLNTENNAIILKLTLVRKPTFIMVEVIIPMTMLALLSPLVFLLPNQSGERVAFSITVLLAISVFMTIVSEHVPQKSKPFPLVLTMLFISYSFMIVVVICVIINARIYCLPEHVRIPRPLIWLLRFSKRLCCCFRRRPKPMEASDNECYLEEKIALSDLESQNRKVVPARNVTWKDISWAIDMFCMTLLYTLKIVLVVVFMLMIKSKQTPSSG